MRDPIFDSYQEIGSDFDSTISWGGLHRQDLNWKKVPQMETGKIRLRIEGASSHAAKQNT